MPPSTVCRAAGYLGHRALRRALHRALRRAAPGLVALAACHGDEERPPERDSAAARADSIAAAALRDACSVGPAQVTGEGVGTVRLGMTAEQLRRRCETTDTAFTLGEGALERGLAVHVGQARVVALLGADSTGDTTVTRIIVARRGATTKGGIGVGSNVASLRLRHGRLCGLVGEGRIVAVAPSVPGVSFATSADYSELAMDTAALRSGALPQRARITEIWVHGYPTSCPQ
ncbi:MAG TPA: hypothetical protein VFS08_15375 [Gemmatimonadaceae bacterium]|nr:hypothetical protein [Gemmatimonadaceae bacterium]